MKGIHKQMISIVSILSTLLGVFIIIIGLFFTSPLLDNFRKLPLTEPVYNDISDANAGDKIRVYGKVVSGDYIDIPITEDGKICAIGWDVDGVRSPSDNNKKMFARYTGFDFSNFAIQTDNNNSVVVDLTAYMEKYNNRNDYWRNTPVSSQYFRPPNRGSIDFTPSTVSESLRSYLPEEIFNNSWYKLTDKRVLSYGYIQSGDKISITGYLNYTDDGNPIITGVKPKSIQVYPYDSTETPSSPKMNILLYFCLVTVLLVTGCYIIYLSILV